MYFGLPVGVSSFTPVSLFQTEMVYEYKTLPTYRSEQIRPNWLQPEFQVWPFNTPHFITPPKDIKHLWHISLDDYLYHRQTRIKLNCCLCLNTTIKSCKPLNHGLSGDTVKFSLAKSRVSYYINMPLKLYWYLNPCRMCQMIEMR